MSGKAACIRAENISMSFGKKEVLQSVSLNIAEGEIFGLLGPSGAGKTSLLKILTGQLRQTGGRAFLFGLDTEGLPRDAYENIGLVLDNTGLYERLSCYDNLLLFAEIYGTGREKIMEALRRTGLAEAKKRPVSRLSKGMRQRLALARAILHEPGLLILDEPTAGLDPSTAAEIHALIREERERGAAVLLTTHNMEEATKLCGHVALLHLGNIVEYGSPAEVCRRYNHLNAICLTLKDGESITVENTPLSAKVVADYLQSGQIESIHSTEPNLETVFMELTGRGFAS